MRSEAVLLVLNHAEIVGFDLRDGPGQADKVCTFGCATEAPVCAFEQTRVQRQPPPAACVGAWGIEVAAPLLV